jgi:murein DD-endopeptidase MepM/ murein hydrolase activator NlpD
MNPVQQAASQNGVSLAQTGPIPAGDTGHWGPGINSQATFQALLNQKTAQSSAQEAPFKGKVDYKQLIAKGYSPTQIEGYLSDRPGITLENAPENWDATILQNMIIPKPAPITETFGEMQPNIEVFSHGVTTGTGIGVNKGTPLATPPGKWKVVEVYDQAPQKGFIGNNAGQGWGNNVLIQNQDTGESLRYSHLSDVHVTTGDEINGSRVIGLSGQSGNTTGDHLNLQYITPEGQPADVLKSQYAKYLPIKG